MCAVERLDENIVSIPSHDTLPSVSSNTEDSELSSIQESSSCGCGGDSDSSEECDGNQATISSTLPAVATGALQMMLACACICFIYQKI